MTTDSPPDTDHETWRSWEWVDRDTFAATPFYRRAWNILKQDWLVYLWKLAADVVARFSTLLFGFFVVTLVLVDFQAFVAAGYFPLEWFERFGHILRSPTFITGLAGSLFMIGVATTALQALIVGGIWGILDDGLRDRPVKMGGSFLRHAIDWFPEVLGLFLVRFALRIVTGLVGAAMLVAVVHAVATGGLATLANWQITVLLTVGVGCFVGWAALSRLVVEVAGAPLILDDVDLGDALLRGAVFSLDNFWSLYRLIIFALGVLLIPLGLYWLAIMFGNLALVWPALEPVGSLLQLATQALLFVSMTVVGLLFWGAVFAFYVHDDGQFAETDRLQ